MAEPAGRGSDELKALLDTDLTGEERASIDAELGRFYVRHGDHDLALRHLVAARRQFEAKGKLRERAGADAVIGAVCTYKGEDERALTYLSRALDAAEEIGDGDLRAHTLSLLAERASRRADWERAEELWTRARTHFDEYWNGTELARCDTGLAMVAVQRRNGRRAAELAGRALENADSTGDPLSIGRAQLASAVANWLCEDHKEAKRFFRRAITLFQKHELRRELAESYLRYGLFCGEMADKHGPDEQDPAAYWLSKAQALFREVGGLSDLERVREAFRRFGRRATDRVAEVEVLHMLQELKQSRGSVQRATQRLSMLVGSTLEQGPAVEPRDVDSEPAAVELHRIEQEVSRSLDEMALVEERFLGAVNAVVVERENIRSLIELTRTLTMIEDDSELVDRMAELACQLTTGERGLVALQDERGKAAVIGRYGIDTERDEAWRQPVETIALRRGRAELLFREQEDPDSEATGPASTKVRDKADARKKRQQRLRLGYGMVVPLRQGDQVLGALHVDKEITGGVFTERDLDLLTVFAGQAATILENRRIQRELRIAARVKAATLDAVTDGVVSVDLDGRITSMNTTAARILGLEPNPDPKVKLPRLSAVHEISFLSGSLHRGEELDSRLLRFGSGEYLCNTRIVRHDSGDAVGLVATFTELKRATSLAHRMVGSTARYSFGDLIGDSSSLKRALVLAQAAAQSDSSVLIIGESGTGKEIIAQAIHNGGPRAAGPFVGVNCAAIPRELLESELFGYESGAFTGARKGGRPGKFELAEGGTILLDEIGDMPLDMQVKLLRVLQERRCQRLGSTRELPLNCRVITTTNRDLAAEIAHGLFRQDLFFRLRVIQIDIPPLRERPEDVAALAEHFLRVFSARMGKRLTQVEPRVMQLLKAYPWPGNVRELEHVLEGEVNLAGATSFALTEVPMMLQQTMVRHAPLAAVPAGPPPLPFAPAQLAVPAAPGNSFASPGQLAAAALKTMSESERELLEAALITHRGRIPEVARALGVSRGTVYNKMKKFNINPSAYRS